MYNPETARFLQEDTYRGDPNDPLSLNLYTYVANNPLIYDDPTGHFLHIVAGASLVGNMAGQYISKGKINWKEASLSGLLGGAVTLAGEFGAKLIKKLEITERIANKTKQLISEAVN